jgi:copper transport protein
MAHANYVKSNPASDARLTKSPTEIRITFSETPDASGSDIAVLDTAGVRKNGTAMRTATDEGNTLAVDVPALPDGGYLVSWKARSAVDGHETQGAFAFAIGNAPLPAIPDIGPSSPPPGPLELAGRALSFAGIALVLGVSFFTLFIRPPTEAFERRRERWLVVAGGALLVVGSVVLFASYGLGLPARLLTFLALRGLAGLVAIAAAFVPGRRVPDDARREITAFAGLAAGLWATLVSHAAASGDPKYIALDFIHVVAISIWSGGVVSLLVLAIPGVADARALGATVWRMSLTALVCVAVIVTTGTLQALDRLVLVEDLYETPYGIALLAKILMLLALVALGATNLLIWGPRLRAQGQGPLSGEQRERNATKSRLALSVMTETGLFGAVLVATAFLTAFAPPAQASGAAFDETQRVEGVRVELLVPTTNPGRNRYVVRVTEGLAPVTDAEKVTLRFTMVEHDMGIQDLDAAQRAPGEYVAEGSPTAMFGTWKVDTIVRLAGRLDLHALFTVPIQNNSGQIAQVIPVPPPPAAPQNNLVVFTDPSQPVSGAPITINIVVIDTKGDPVQGQKVTASFSGPGTQAPIDAKEDAVTLGPGRYRIEIPALDAGQWKVSLTLGSIGSGTYTLDVTR